MSFKTLKLPDSLRESLKEPFGKLLSGLEEFDKKREIICVGDETSRIVLESGLKPRVLIYDSRIKRKDVPLHKRIDDFNAREVRVSNPPGHITCESISAIDSAFRSPERVKIMVNGEEDLLTIAAIDRAPEGSIVLYGQPDEGLVEVEVTKESKKRAKKILEQMDVEENEY